MITLIYHSVALNICSEEKLNLFLTSVRRKNIRLNITGVLLYHRRNILQIIEGENDTIYELIERIKIDNRHTDVVKLVDFKITKRSYVGWSMAFKQLSKKDWMKVKGYLNIETEESLVPQYSDKSCYLKVLINSFIYENNLI